MRRIGLVIPAQAGIQTAARGAGRYERPREGAGRYERPREGAGWYEWSREGAGY